MTEKIAIVTGGTSGIGLCTAAALQKQGCKVYTISRRDFSDSRFTHIRADVTDPADCLGSCAALLFVDAVSFGVCVPPA